MLYLRFCCAPATESTSGFGGAIINCWIKELDGRDAEEFARSVIEERGWNIESIEDRYPIAREDYADGHSPEGLAAFEDAERTGQCFVCHTFFSEAARN